MIQPIRAICTDIDGTLLDSRRELSDRTLSSIKRIKNTVPVILASSRMPAAMRHLQYQLDIPTHPLICFNGGYVIQYMDAGVVSVLENITVPLQICRDIVALTAHTTIHTSLYHADEWYAPQNDQWSEREARITKVSPAIKPFEKVISDWEIEGKGAHKIMCMGPEAEIQRIQDILSSEYETVVHAYRSKSTYLEISPRAISKASALLMLINTLYRIKPADVMAFGDNYNDIEMIRAVGWGIAVDNARNEVKQVAREITLSNILDGVAVAIDKYVL
jgi:Cof subfamily protein (haloacid dehalogenase superfamily)